MLDNVDLTMLVMNIFISFIFSKLKYIRNITTRFNTCSYYMLDNVDSMNVSYEYSNLVKTPS
jgi:hypothetical protein